MAKGELYGDAARGRHFVSPFDEPSGVDDEPDTAPVVPLLPAMAGRIESVHGALAALSIRIDGLVGATNSLRTALAEQIEEYTDAVSGVVRAQSQEVEDYRRANERVVAELRRGSVGGDDVSRRLSLRLDELGADVAAVTDTLRNVGAETRQVTSATEKLVHLVTAGLDEFGEHVLARLETIAEAAGQRQPIEFSGGSGFSELPQPVIDTAPLVAVVREMVAEDVVGPVREELAQLKRRLAVRAKAPLVLESTDIERLAESVAARLHGWGWWWRRLQRRPGVGHRRCGRRPPGRHLRGGGRRAHGDRTEAPASLATPAPPAGRFVNSRRPPAIMQW